jgi:hypothetical protein
VEEEAVKVRVFEIDDLPNIRVPKRRGSTEVLRERCRQEVMPFDGAVCTFNYIRDILGLSYHQTRTAFSKEGFRISKSRFSSSRKLIIRKDEDITF